MVERSFLEKQTRKWLCDYCRSHGIKGYSGKTKEERINLILKNKDKPIIIEEKYKVPKEQRKDIYDEEKGLMDKDFIVVKPWKIKNSVMKKGDVLTVIGYGSGQVSHYIEFTNKRLPKHKYRTGTWLFKKNVTVQVINFVKCHKCGKPISTDDYRVHDTFVQFICGKCYRGLSEKEQDNYEFDD